MKEIELINEIVNYFEKNIFTNHIEASINKHSKLKSYKINPILVKYLSKVLENDYNSEGVAKALFYPRVLGTSINTSFGTQIQKMFVELEMATGAYTKKLDIEFIDKVDQRKKFCQLKSGPMTLNSGDVKPLMDKFAETIRLAKTNYAMRGISNTDFIVGVLYGDDSDLSEHYMKIDKTYPVIVGKEFWYRLTGYPKFYDSLVIKLHQSINKIDTKNLINKGYEELEKEIKDSKYFNFRN